MRKEQSIGIIYTLLLNFRKSIFNFSITNNVNLINGNDFFSSMEKTPRYPSKYDNVKKEIDFNPSNINGVEIKDDFRIMLFNDGVHKIYYDQFRNWTPSFEVGLMHAEGSNYYFKNKLMPLDLKQFKEFYNNAINGTDSSKKAASEKFMLGIKNSFPFFENLISANNGKIDLIINLNNLSVGKNSGIIKFYDKKSLDELSKISEYKISTVIK